MRTEEMLREYSVMFDLEFLSSDPGAIVYCESEEDAVALSELLAQTPKEVRWGAGGFFKGDVMWRDAQPAYRLRTRVNPVTAKHEVTVTHGSIGTYTLHEYRNYTKCRFCASQYEQQSSFEAESVDAIHAFLSWEPDE